MLLAQRRRRIIVGRRATASAYVNRKKSLTQLEDNDWGAATYDSNLVSTIHLLRDKPIGEFTIEDLRITIGQNVGLSHLLPIAVERLKERPLAQGDFYPGDLLRSVLTSDPAYWSEHPDQRRHIAEIAHQAVQQLEKSDNSTKITRDALLEGLAQCSPSE